ncbi:Putative membrane protein [Shigella dysenteriae 1617]|nr:Putative membrane protein [Shigella dysenteriae 1617]
MHSIEELTAIQNGTAEMHVCDVQGFACAYQEGVQTMSDGKVRHAIFMTLLDNTNLIQLVAAIDPDYFDEYQEEVMKMMLSARQHLKNSGRSR